MMQEHDIKQAWQLGADGGTISVVASFKPTALLDSELAIAERELPILPLRHSILFPETLLPISVNSKAAVRLLEEANEKDTFFAVFSQKDEDSEKPTEADLYRVGTVAKVVKMLQLPDGNLTAFIQGYRRVRLLEAHNGENYMVGRVEAQPEQLPAETNSSFRATVASCKEMTEQLAQHAEGGHMGGQFELKDVQSCVFFVNFICSSIPIANTERQQLLEMDDMAERAIKLLEILGRECDFAKLKESIRKRTHQDMSQQQREFFLRREMENIKEELGEGSDNDVAELMERASHKQWNETVERRFTKEIAKLQRIPTQAPDYSSQYEWLDVFLRLPWGEITPDNLNLKRAARVLAQDHYGMEKVKERILEHLAVVKLRGDMKSPIICLYGPPGVGKTSLGKSIARAMGRKYVRMSVGGLHDEAEIRGHRRTYVGAMPGRIIKGLLDAQSANPVFILDEIDKVSGATVNGDPSSALLEVLDPEQNNSFHDNYVDEPFDLSNVMFIATANNISSIPTPLLDRMELIEVSGYLAEEKVEIAKRHLLPKQLEAVGLQKQSISLSRKAIEKIIENYTRESGVRELDKKIGKLIRKIALEQLTSSAAGEGNDEEKTFPGVVKVKDSDIARHLGLEEYNRSRYEDNDYAGVVTGLAWTAVGGEILFVETSVSEGKGSKLTLTGNLGDVMKESAMLALEYIRAHTQTLGISCDIFDKYNLHVHVPEGAVPKDGPSAGITIATSIASALTGRKVRPHLAMTGEITLRGKVLPVGGIKEKILAAKRAGITDIVLCHENERHIKDIPQQYLKGVTFHYVHDVQEVWHIALLQEQATNALTLS